MSYVVNTSTQLKPILVGFRKSQGMSQRDMAEKLNISQQAYQSMEANPQSVTLDRLMKVLSTLGVKLYLSDTPLNSSLEKTESQQSEVQSSFVIDKPVELSVSHKVKTANAPSIKVKKKLNKDSW